MIFPLAAALLVLGQAVLAPPPSPDQVAIAADHAHYDLQTQRLTADGHVELRSAQVSLRADHLVYDEADGRVQAQNALIVLGTGVGVADRIEVDLETLRAKLTHGTFVEKKGVSLDALLRARTADAAKALGTNTLAVSGNAVRRISPDEIEVDGLSFTPCDCDPLHPHWHIQASHANVRAGDRALLTWPVVYVYKVPVLALPWLYLPLSDRKTGLLIPIPSNTTTSGWHLSQPVFVTLGESYDLTFTPGYFFGNEASVFGVKGPHLGTEFRYVPSTQTTGRIALNLIDDRRAARDPVNPAIHPGGFAGLRGDLQLQHTQQLGKGWEDRVDLNLLSDGYLYRDLTTDILATENQYLRSTAEIDHRADDSLFVADAVFRQDVRCTNGPQTNPGTHCVGFDLFETDRTTGSPGYASPRTLQKLPELLSDFPLRPLGPLFGSLAVRYTRLSPFIGRFGDEGVDGIYDPSNFDPGQGDRIFEKGEREARSRFDFNPTLSARLPLGRYLELDPYAALREDLYAGELTGDTAQHGYAYAGVSLRTELVRRFASLGLTHAITPSIEFRYAPGAWGQTVVPYDEIDTAMPDQGITQAVAQIAQRLYRRVGTTDVELARLTLGQELDFRQARKARDSFLSGALQLGPVQLGGVARYDLPGRRLSQLSAGISGAIGTFARLWGSYDDLLVSGPDRLRQGIDALVGLPYPAGVDDRARQLRLGTQLSPGAGLTFGYAAWIQPGDPIPLLQQSFTLGFAPACDCWRLDLGLVASRSASSTFGLLAFQASLVISHFGTIGTGP